MSFILTWLFILYLFVVVHSVVSNFLQPHGLQHARLLCPSPSPKDFSNACLLSRWCHPTILSSVIPFFFCLQSFPASGPFLISQLFASGGQSICIFSFSISPFNEYSELISLRIDWCDLLAVQGTNQISLISTSQILSCEKDLHILSWNISKN